MKRRDTYSRRVVAGTKFYLLYLQPLARRNIRRMSLQYRWLAYCHLHMMKTEYGLHTRRCSKNDWFLD